MIVNKINTSAFSSVKSANILSHFRLISSSSVFFKDSEDSGKDDAETKKLEETTPKALSDDLRTKNRKQALKNLLKDLAKNPSFTELPPEKSIELAQPKQKQRAKQASEKEQAAKDDEDKPLGTRLEDAAKNIAKTLGGDEAKTESELLNILLSMKREPKKIEDIVKGMKAEESVKSAQQERRSLRRSETFQRTADLRIGAKKSASAQLSSENVSARLFGELPLNIFPEDYLSKLKKNPPINLSTWNAQLEREIKLSVTHSPKNYFEELIKWTNEGKLWNFPIDNEQGLDEEKQVHFSEHIMLMDHLEPWCPPKGPIRHFMELVCVGLSKNPYYTVEEKKDHIYYYYEYFKGKNDLLRDTGCGEIQDIGDIPANVLNKGTVEPRPNRVNKLSNMF